MGEIVKVQVPFSSGAPFLVYAKDRVRISLLSALPVGVTNQLRGDMKGYFKANWAHGIWHIGDRVEEQNW